MRFIRTRPFLALAAFTLALGGVWHSSGLDSDEGPLGFALYAASYVLGTPFILAMRAVGSLVSHPILRGFLGFALGLLPYLAADEAVRRHRMRREPRVVEDVG